MKLLLITANVLLPIAVLVFASGFFPYKPFIPGLATHQDLGDHGDPPPPQFDRLVFMVIDALRSDFVFSSASGFSFTQKLIRSGDAVPFTAHASPPTVTMPRVKAITTGSIPSFLDVILNFAESDSSSSLALQDTWLAQIRAGRNGTNTGKLVMYGDDTWLKLFPDMFTRADGTSSFFVSDFTEVDQNVTRHVPEELIRDDWDAMIMHYLGLDHIGHKAGPMSPNMVPKHMEMDGIIRQIYYAISQLPHLESTLFVLCGDHGMNEAGNHGGGGSGETSTALVFISPKLRPLSPSGRKCPTTPKQNYDFYTKVDQSDLAPTISTLMGVPVPRNNLGVFIPDFLGLWKDPKDQLQILHRNALQILKIVKAQFPGADFDNVDDMSTCEDSQSDDQELACAWQKASRRILEDQSSNEELKPALNALFLFCKKAQDVMSGAASNYDLPRMIIGIALSGVALLLTAFQISGTASLANQDIAVFGLLIVLYGVMMFASSYVEEEQHFWYWTTAGWVAYTRFRSLQKELKGKAMSTAGQFASFAILLAHRVIQRWNQTGQKHAGAPDIVNHYLFPQPILLWTLVALTYTIVSLRIAYTFSTSLDIHFSFGSLAAAFLTIPAMIFKVGFTSADAPELFYWLQGEEVEWLQQIPLVLVARAIFGILALQSCILLAKNRLSTPGIRKPNHGNVLSALHSLLTLLLITQSRTANIPLFLLFQLQFFSLSKLPLTATQTSILALLLAHTSFFALGGSNAISSVDLSSAYNGVSGYNVLAVGILVFVSNWAGPIWWAVSALVLITSKRTAPNKGRSWIQEERELLAKAPAPDKSNNPKKPTIDTDSYTIYISLATLWTAGSLLAVMAACTALRTHLFIWTVFSPKYLYSMAWTLAYHLLISLGLNGALWSLRS